jgi:hypothetical protein
MEARAELYRGHTLTALNDGKSWRVQIGDIGPSTTLHSERDDALAEARKRVDQLIAKN